jgi:hypothetical protein
MITKKAETRARISAYFYFTQKNFLPDKNLYNIWCDKVWRWERRYGAFPNAAGGDWQRRTRGWPTPHAKFVISACGVAHLCRQNFGSNHAPFDHSECCGYTFFALRLKTRLCNLLIIIIDSI